MPTDSIWLRPEVAGSGRPAERSRAEITAAAVALADAEGFAAVSMRSVAAALGTGAASLYRYVANRSELIALMLDAVYQELELRHTDSGGRADLVEASLEVFRAGHRHAWFAEAVVEYPFVGGPGSARLTEFCLAALADDPAAGQHKMEAIGVLGGMVQGYLGFLTRQNVSELMAQHAAYLGYLAQGGKHPHIAALLAEPGPATPEAPEATLARILPLVLNGLLGPEPPHRQA